jgi:hypothetical protein
MGTPHESTSGATLFLNPGDVEARLEVAAVECVYALGLVRVLTLLPLCDPALDEVEHRLAAVQTAVFDARRLFAEARALAEAGEGRS